LRSLDGVATLPRTPAAGLVAAHVQAAIKDGKLVIDKGRKG
jgi:hypothetical protein